MGSPCCSPFPERMLQPSKTEPACCLKQEGRQSPAEGPVMNTLRRLMENLRERTLLCLVPRTEIRSFEQKLSILTQASQEREKLFMEKPSMGPFSLGTLSRSSM